jgi:hypothetical protein
VEVKVKAASVFAEGRRASVSRNMSDQGRAKEFIT